MALPEGPGDPLVLVNPHASRLHDPATRARVAHDIGQAVTHATGRTPRVVDDEDRVTAELALAEAVASGSPLVVAVGGDGTVRDAATRLAGTGVAIAIVPGGTANLFAATAGVPTRIDRAIALIGRGRSVALDLGRVRWGGFDDLALPGLRQGQFLFRVPAIR